MTETFIKQYNSLNPEQKKAVDTLDGPVMVVAGPGTGKTQILALRIANILKKTDVSAQNILCLTFTEAGVKAMRERLFKFIGSAAYQVTISTFHGFSNEVIQTFQEKFAFSKELIQLDELNRLKIIQKIIDQLEDPFNKRTLIPFHNKYSKQWDIIKSIQDLKKEAIAPNKLREITHELINNHKENIKLKNGEPTKKWQSELEKLETILELADIYQKYQEMLLEEGFYDYEDMIMFVIEKFKTDDELLAHYQERYLYIHVDEYQDTNGSQNEILRLLTNWDDTPNIFVVGDDDQAIYRFQGASLANILFFEKNYQKVATIPTLTNYRSSQLILDLAHSLIQNNQTRLTTYKPELNKKLKSISTSTGLKAEIYEFRNADEENFFVAKEIAKLHESGVEYSEIAVLFRRNSHAEDINEVLIKSGIPTKLDSSKQLFDNTFIKQIVNLLKLIHLYSKDINNLLYEVMLYEFNQIPAINVYKITRAAADSKTKLIDLISNREEILAIIQNEERTQQIFNFFNRIVEMHKCQFNLTLPRFIEKLINDFGIRDFALIKNEDALNAGFENIIALNTFYEYAKSQYSVDQEIKLGELLNDINIMEENSIKLSLPKTNSQQDTVNLMTAHSSKGLEFKYVFIIKATDKNWGSTRSAYSILPKEVFYQTELELDEKQLILEDERRLFFVAITRAKEKVYFTYADEYIQNGTSALHTQTQFLTELDPSLVDNKSSKTSEELKLDIEDLKVKLAPLPKPDYSEEEKCFLQEQIEKLKLTPSDLNLYLESPKRFKEEKLIKVPKSKTKEAAMGTAIHYALEKLDKSFDGTSFQSVDFLLKNYEENLVKEFYGEDEFEKTLVEGKNHLAKYYDEVILKGNFEKALETEYNFSSHKVYLPDKFGGNPICISGRIDKIVLLNPTTNEVKVIDYKTGRSKSRNDILGNTQNSIGSEWNQLVFYKLLGDLDDYFRPGKAFAKSKYNITEAEIDFIKPNQSGKFVKHNFQIASEDVEKLKDLICEVVKRIRNLEFPDETDIIY